MYNIIKYNRWLGLILIVFFYNCQEKMPVDKIEKVKQFISSHNQKDIDGKLKQFTQDVEIIVDKDTICRGTEAFRQLSDWDVQMESQLTIIKCINDKEIINCKIVEKALLYKYIGLDSITFSNVRFIFNQDLIKEVKLEKTKNNKIQFAGRVNVIKNMKVKNDFLLKLFSGKLELNKNNAIEIIDELKLIAREGSHKTDTKN